MKNQQWYNLVELLKSTGPVQPEAHNRTDTDKEQVQHDQSRKVQSRSLLHAYSAGSNKVGSLLKFVEAAGF
jgi:hypothetical protein